MLSAKLENIMILSLVNLLKINEIDIHKNRSHWPWVAEPFSGIRLLKRFSVNKD